MDALDEEGANALEDNVRLEAQVLLRKLQRRLALRQLTTAN